MKAAVANRLRTTFLPADDPDGSERRTVAGQPIVIYRPTGVGTKIVGLTFVITAANIPLSKYASIISTLTKLDRVVIGFFVNVLNPPTRGNHRSKAMKVRDVFNEVREEFHMKRYDMIGHSIGGKIALLVAALYDEENCVRSIIALDPVDQSPVEFTNAVPSSVGTREKLSKIVAAGGKAGGTSDEGDGAASRWARGSPRENLTLEESRADITLTFTDTGYWIKDSHDAREIQRRNPSTKLVLHRNTYHMVYCDDDGQLSWKALMGRGVSDDRNRMVREETLALIREGAIMRTNAAGVAGHATGVISTAVGKAKRTVTAGISDLKGMGEDVKKKGTALAGAATLAKVMG